MTLQEYIAKILDVDIEDVGEDAGMNETEKWDSLKQMNIMLSLERDFDIRFEEEQIMDCNSLKSIDELLRDKGVNLQFFFRKGFK